ncbi:MAG TPA: MobF family relaxase [Mycobacterium sp.]|nr:MobF family relaxase [Mycobacterium sp.]
MTVSIRRMTTGSGFRYLMESVVRGDGAVERSSPLTRYYAESGTPPGRFLGAGLAGLAGGAGVEAGSQVSEAMLRNMLHLVVDPITGQPLGRKPRTPSPTHRESIEAPFKKLAGNVPAGRRREAVARLKAVQQMEPDHGKRPLPVSGFDLTFSVPKSVSAAWAVADAGTQAVIYEAHQEAIRRALAYAERHVFFSRSGTNGIVQERIRGVVAAGFDHWDSRAGDPHLHTHVVVLNRAQSADGRWRTLDSRGLFKQVVTLSELHEGILMDILAEQLGWGFDPRQRIYRDQPKYDVTGVSEALTREFSQRSAQIEQNKNAQLEAFVAAHGYRPSIRQIVRMRQSATLSTRPDKQHHSLAEQTELWRERARAHVGQDTVAWVETLAGRNDLPRLRCDDLTDPMLRDAAGVALHRVAERRPTFTRANLLAEVHRQLHAVRFARPDDRIAVAERTADLAEAMALRLSAPELHHTPGRFRRADGSSMFRGQGTAIFTTRALLDAEARLLDAGRATTGPAVQRVIVAAVAEANLPGKDYVLSTDQALAVEQVATSGRVLDVLVGPAGTGKSSSMAGLRTMWERQHGPGSVIGLAPSAAAAEVLADELGIATENTAKWLTEHARQPERQAALRRVQGSLARLPNPGSRPARRLRKQIERLQADHARWTIRPGQLVIIDEASLAGTFALDALAAQAREAGAKVLLVGDWAQLSAVESGGAFSMLVRDRELAPELTDARRFRDQWEKAASIRLRVGDTDAITAYTTHGRIESGNREDLLDTLYTAWKADTDAGRASLMIAADADTVAELNRRARADRIAAGEVAERGLTVADASVAGVGDRVVTRRNDRRLSTGRRWVKNGDAWIVSAIGHDGAMTVKRANGSGEVVLPAAYAREHVELGYACTAHRAQGRTVDTAHAMVSATTTREVLYVAATRGRDSNRLYVDNYYDPDQDTSHGPVRPRSVEDLLTGVLGNTGADISAHAALAHDLHSAESIPTLAAEYLTIARAAQAARWDALLDRAGLTPEQLEQIRESDAYGPLLAAFRNAEARGLDIEAAFPGIVAGRDLDTATDLAATLHERVANWARANSHGPSQAASRLVAGIIPEALGVTDPDLQRALTERADAMNRRALMVAEQAVTASAVWTRPLGPPPADPTRRTAWIREIATIAAYRERWGVTGRDPIAADRASIEKTGHEKRAQAAAERATLLAGATTPAPPTGEEPMPVVDRNGIER